jgi:hypothetical protein
MGERAEDFSRHYLTALSREKRGFERETGTAKIKIAILDTSKSLEASALWKDSYANKEGLEIHRLDIETRDDFFDKLKARLPSTTWFTDSEGPLDFIKSNGGAELLEDTRHPGVQNFSVATERLRLTIYTLCLINASMENHHTTIPELIWITDDDGAIRPSETTAGQLIFPKMYSPTVYAQVSDLLKESPYLFSVAGFTGDLPAPLLTMDYNLFILRKIFEVLSVITNPAEKPTKAALQAFCETVISSGLQELKENYQTALPINYSWWYGLTWQGIAEKLIGLFCRELGGSTAPIKIATDNYPWTATPEIPFTNVVTNIELMTLVPYLPPPFGAVRGSDTSWFHTMKDTITGMKGRPVKMFYERHPHFFHRQEVLKTRPNIGKWIAQRSCIQTNEGDMVLMRGSYVNETMFNQRIEEIIARVAKIPWLRKNDKLLLEAYTSYKLSVYSGYKEERTRGSVRFKDPTARNKFARLYIAEWRKMCKNIFPNITIRLEEDLKLDILDGQSVPIDVNFNFLKSSFRL